MSILKKCREQLVSHLFLVDFRDDLESRVHFPIGNQIFCFYFQETGSTGNSWDFGSGLLNTPVLKDRLLTDSIGVENSAGEEGFPVNAEHSYSLGGSNSTANSTFNGSDGDSMPESPLSLDDGKLSHVTFFQLLLTVYCVLKDYY